MVLRAGSFESGVLIFRELKLTALKTTPRVVLKVLKLLLPFCCGCVILDLTGWCCTRFNIHKSFHVSKDLEHGMNMRMKGSWLRSKVATTLCGLGMVKTAVGSKGFVGAPPQQGRLRNHFLMEEIKKRSPMNRLWEKMQQEDMLVMTGNDGNGKSLVAYTGASSSRGNDDYIKRSDLDALFKMLKENGNTYGYSFGASMIAYKDDQLIRELVE
ncbi:hypothetical protein IGI04_043097, partial [Brassica rapa subsp. trilocularis]